jgi:hypothetical protein
MRWIAAVFLTLVILLPARAEDAVFYIKCRIWDSVPTCGPLHHVCVVICDDKVPPLMPDGTGNPSLTYWGCRPSHPGFAPEAYVVQGKAQKINVPPAVVKQRLTEYNGKWTLIKNCQTAANWAVSKPGKWSVWACIMGK